LARITTVSKATRVPDEYGYRYEHEAQNGRGEAPEGQHQQENGDKPKQEIGNECLRHPRPPSARPLTLHDALNATTAEWADHGAMGVHAV